MWSATLNCHVTVFNIWVRISLIKFKMDECFFLIEIEGNLAHLGKLRIPGWLCRWHSLHFCNIEDLMWKIEKLKMYLLPEQIYYGATTPRYWISQQFMIVWRNLPRFFQISLQFKNYDILAGIRDAQYSSLP